MPAKCEWFSASAEASGSARIEALSCDLPAVSGSAGPKRPDHATADRSEIDILPICARPVVDDPLSRSNPDSGQPQLSLPDPGRSDEHARRGGERVEEVGRDRELDPLAIGQSWHPGSTTLRGPMACATDRRPLCSSKMRLHRNFSGRSGLHCRRRCVVGLIEF